MNIISCPLCSSNRFKLTLKAREFTLFTNNIYNIVTCRHCNLSFINPQPDQKELDIYYPEAYFCQPEDKVRRKLPLFINFSKVRETLRFKKQGKLLDVGCGSGEFIYAMEQKGWRVFGIEKSPIACELARGRINKDNIFKGDIVSAPLENNYFDVITFWHVLEHLPDPVQALKKANATLNKEGILIICVPNFNSILRLIFRDCWFPLSIPHHLFQFTPSSLEQALHATGFKLIKRKKHFVDSITNMGSFKISLLRSLGLRSLSSSTPVYEQKAEPKNNNIFWLIGRFCFNTFCFLISLILSIFGNEETVLVWAKKVINNEVN